MLQIAHRQLRPFLLAFLAVLGGGDVLSRHRRLPSGKPEGLYYKSWAIVIGVENYLLAPKFPARD